MQSPRAAVRLGPPPTWLSTERQRSLPQPTTVGCQQAWLEGEGSHGRGLLWGEVVQFQVYWFGQGGEEGGGEWGWRLQALGLWVVLPRRPWAVLDAPLLLPGAGVLGLKEIKLSACFTKSPISPGIKAGRSLWSLMGPFSPSRLYSLTLVMWTVNQWFLHPYLQKM